MMYAIAILCVVGIATGQIMFKLTRRREIFVAVEQKRRKTQKMVNG